VQSAEPASAVLAAILRQWLRTERTKQELVCLAPHRGRVSNFRHPVSPLIGPMVAHCFESDPCELLARVHDRHAVWTRLELAKGFQGNFRMRRDPGLENFLIG
jgi:hypothetical protein